jgi:hypothetical protein
MRNDTLELVSFAASICVMAWNLLNIYIYILSLLVFVIRFAAMKAIQAMML